jgi:hypothetical protein
MVTDVSGNNDFDYLNPVFSWCSGAVDFEVHIVLRIHCNTVTKFLFLKTHLLQLFQLQDCQQEYHMLY